MLIIKRLLNWCEIVGYAKASAELSRQGFHAEAKALMLEKTKLQGIKERALVRLETKKKFKSEYDPAKHYMSCLLYTSPSPRDTLLSRMPSSA